MEIRLYLPHHASKFLRVGVSMSGLGSVHPSDLTPELPSGKEDTWFSPMSSSIWHWLSRRNLVSRRTKCLVAHLTLTARKSGGRKRSSKPDLVVQSCNPSYFQG